MKISQKLVGKMTLLKQDNFIKNNSTNILMCLLFKIIKKNVKLKKILILLPIFSFRTLYFGIYFNINLHQDVTKILTSTKYLAHSIS